MVRPLNISDLTREADLSDHDFQTTREIAPSDSIIGQERAVTSLNFGLNVDGIGYNLYVAGPPGIGKMSAVIPFVEKMAEERNTPTDWCYLYNFDDPYRPNICALPAGKARELQKDMAHVIEQIRDKLVRVFESDDYAARRNEITQSAKSEQESIYDDLNRKAKEWGFKIKPTPMGIFFTLLKENGEPMEEAEFDQLPEDQKGTLNQKRKAIENQLNEFNKKTRKIERGSQEQLKKLDKDVVMNLVGGMIDDLIEKYRQMDPIKHYLNRVQEDIAEHIDLFKPTQKQKARQQPPNVQMQVRLAEEQAFKKYAVNVLVDNAKQKGVPVVVERNPSYHNVFGRIEKEVHMGGYSTDFTMIRSGSLHRANGGYLILQMEDVLRNFLTWDSLKRALTSKEIQIEELGERLGFLSTKTLRPEPMPLDVKVILIGRPVYYYLLHHYDEEFAELFKVKADFDTVMNRDQSHISHFLGFVSSFCHKEGLRCLSRPAVSHLLKHASRLADDKEKLSTHFGALADVLRESHYWAGQDDSAIVQSEHVQKAIDAKIYRSGLIKEKLQEMTERGTLLIETTGRVVGQVNGLSVLDLGDTRFGKPTRITATVGPGRDGIMDIEREVKLGGPVHSKGILILGGYLSKRFAGDHPLALSARIVFEQSYSGIEGDSASSAELYALISALSDLPLHQGIAVTGSVNQKGEVQAIGGVNEKIEGFFDLCNRTGLTGDQGVLIPQSNVKNLMLKQDVLDAVEADQFHIWAVSHIDEGIEILADQASGKPAGDGKFPDETVNGRVRGTLRRYAEDWQKILTGSGNGDA